MSISGYGRTDGTLSADGRDRKQYIHFFLKSLDVAILKWNIVFNDGKVSC